MVARCLALAGLLVLGGTAAGEDSKKTLWKGLLHMGDNPEAYPKATSGGMAFQVPFRAKVGQATKLAILVDDVNTQAGNGHIVEVLAHFEKQPNKAPASEVVVDTFRVKDESGAEKSFEFVFNSGKNLNDRKPDYYSVRIKIDTHVGFTFWDDFLIKRIDLEQ